MRPRQSREEPPAVAGGFFFCIMTNELQGTSIIGFSRGSATADMFTAFDPTTADAVEPSFHSATLDELNRACSLADSARLPYGNLPGRERAVFLRKIADN